jgi:tetratricopeptide (TPR) repeat protein
MKNLCFVTILLLATAVFTSAQSTDSKSILRRGDALVAQENYKLAIEEYGKVSTRDRDAFARAAYNIGVCYYELWQTDDAIEFYKRAIDLKQGNYAKASYALGVALEDQGKTTEARNAYEQARRELPRATYRIGVLEAKAGEFEKAAALFREAAARAGEHVPASHNNLGVMLARLGYLKEAEQEFILALKASQGRFDDAAHNLNLCHKNAQKAQNDLSKIILSLL